LRCKDSRCIKTIYGREGDYIRIYFLKYYKMVTEKPILEYYQNNKKDLESIIKNELNTFLISFPKEFA
jgi:hypothetical protein